MTATDRVVVVGASLAGVRTAQSLRERGFDGELVIIGADDHLPYDRPPLSKGFLSGEQTTADIRLLSETDVVDLALDLRLGRRANSLDPAARSVSLDDGSTVAYDKLVIATGVAPRVPAGWRSLDGVHTLRTIADSTSLRAEFGRSPRVAVIGGGFIGCEVAATARQLGLDVAIVEPLAAPLARAIGPELSAAFAGIHRDAGVALHLGRTVEAFEGADRLERIRLSGGRTIDADVAVIGIGTVPQTDWLAGSGVALDDGVLCDHRCATSVPDVFAAGDVARWVNPLFGETMRVEHWTNAAEQGAFVAGALLDDPRAAEFASVPFVWSHQHGEKIEIAGAVRATDDVRIVQGSIADRAFLAHFERDGVLVGAVAVNATRALVGVRRTLAGRARSTPTDEPRSTQPA